MRPNWPDIFSLPLSSHILPSLARYRIEHLTAFVTIAFSLPIGDEIHTENFLFFSLACSLIWARIAYRVIWLRRPSEHLSANCSSRFS